MMLRPRVMEADLTPEHAKRDDGHDLHPDVVAAYAYVDRVLNTSDYTNPYAWHGWALREAFLAGISHAAAAPIDVIRLDAAEGFEPPTSGL